MTFKQEAIALGVRLVAEHTNLIQKPDTFTAAIYQFLGEESYDRRLARNIEVEAARAADSFKRFQTERRRKHTRITQ